MTAKDNTASRAGAVLVAGASGYVGGRVLRALEAADVPVRCLARRPDLLAPRVAAATQVVRGDVLDAASLPAAMAGIETAYYLVRLSGGPKHYPQRERAAAANFAIAARQNGLRRIIYLARLGGEGARASLRVRTSHEVGKLLADAGVGVVEFRAAPVIGSGSAAFELARALAQRPPVALGPRWTHTRCQPLAVEDLLEYLLAARLREPGGREIFEIGCPEAVTFARLVRECARRQGRTRLLIPLPVGMQRLSAAWLTLATPLPYALARTVVDSLQFPAVVRDEAACGAFDVAPRPLSEAVERALSNEGGGRAATHWAGAMGPAGDAPRADETAGRAIVEEHAARARCTPAQAFALLRRLGGRFGWRYATSLWRLRGRIDRLIGGVGLRQGRPAGRDLRPGSVVDFWRVEAFEPTGSSGAGVGRLRLAAELRLPGTQWLEFEVRPAAEGGCTIRLTAAFTPAGLAGRAYWYLLQPVRRIVLAGMLARIAALADKVGTAGKLEVVAADPSTWAGCEHG